MDINTTQKLGEENPSKQQSSEILHREPINATPYELVGSKEMGWWIAFGKYKVSDTYPDSLREEQDHQAWAWRILDTDEYNIIVNTMAIMTEFTKLDLINWIKTNIGKPIEEEKNE